MKNRKLQKYLYEHPELLDDAFSMPLTEADRWASENARTAAEMIALAKQKHPEIAAEKWEAFDKAARKAKQKRVRSFTVPTFRIRWWQVAVAFVLVVVLTFTLVPPARAWAERIIHYLFSYSETPIGPVIDIHREDELVWHSFSPDEMYLTEPIEDDYDEGDTNVLDKTYTSVEAFIEETGYHPAILSPDAYRLESLRAVVFLDAANGFAMVTSIYVAENGDRIFVYTDFADARGASYWGDDTDTIIHTTALGGREVAGFIGGEGDDGVMLIMTLDDRNMDICIQYEGASDYREVLDALQLT